MENPYFADSMALVSAALWPALLFTLLKSGALSQADLQDLIEGALKALDGEKEFSPHVVQSARAALEEFYELTAVKPDGVD